jgi:hypothetical protein
MELCLLSVLAFQPDQTEECGEGCLCVANIDNDPKGVEKIITGSFQGYLRIYTPRQQGYKVDDLMEFQLDEPILQIEAGRFVKSVGDALADRQRGGRDERRCAGMHQLLPSRDAHRSSVVPLLSLSPSVAFQSREQVVFGCAAPS